MARKKPHDNAPQDRTTERDARRFALVPEQGTDMAGEKASNANVVLFTVAVFAATFIVGIAVCCSITGSLGVIPLTCAAVIAALVASSLHICQQWERVVVLRMGKLNRVVSPGFFWTIPIVEGIAMRIDQRVRVTTFGAEETLTSDLVPMNVNAVLFWMVYDAEKACTEVGDFTRAVELAAQTALRDALGRSSAAEVAIKRGQLDRELKEALADKVTEWGLSVLSVEIRDILLPRELQDVMSLEAQAEQRRKARIALMEAENDISEMIKDLSPLYADDECAMRLRAMHLLNESVRETGSTVLLPSSFSEGFGDILPEGFKAKL